MGHRYAIVNSKMINLYYKGFAVNYPTNEVIDIAVDWTKDFDIQKIEDLSLKEFEKLLDDLSEKVITDRQFEERDKLFEFMNGEVGKKEGKPA